MKQALLLLLAIVSSTLAATASQWRDRSIYQLLTDRFARPDGNTSYPCPGDFQGFCGGTWAGITSKLDYIQVSSLAER
jgi:alpha-amylase